MEHFNKAKSIMQSFAHSTMASAQTAAQSAARTTVSKAQASWTIHPPTATWQKIAAPALPRSSHTVSIVSGCAYIFGGEIEPRKPVDNDMHVVILPTSEYSTDADYRTVAAAPAVPDGPVPEKRVGHSAVVIGERIFIFGGRGGADMQPLDENGRVWIFDTRSARWSFLDPTPGTSYPEARSYHASVAMDEPTWQRQVPADASIFLGEPLPGEVAKGATSVEQEGGYGTLFIHAGCPLTGRVNDIWAFDVRRRTWTELPAAPSRARGGTSLAISRGRIYRYGGFNGVDQEGGMLDILDLGLESWFQLPPVPKTLPRSMSDIQKMAAARSNTVSPGINPRACRWETVDFLQNSVPAPGKRSVAGLHVVPLGNGREYLVMLLGEREASAAGHAGAGRYWPDVWAYQIPAAGMSYMGVRDAAWKALRQDVGEGAWAEVQTRGDVDDDGVEGPLPSPRGWFASSPLGDLNKGAVFVWGGLNAQNAREGDGWILKFD